MSKDQKAKKAWEAPAGFSKTAQLTQGKARIKVSHRIETVEAKIMVWGKYLRDTKGNIRTEKMKVPATVIRVVLDDGTILQSRSCCKPPDSFNARMGTRLAMKRLFAGDSAKALGKEDRRTIIATLRSSLSRKKKKSSEKAAS